MKIQRNQRSNCAQIFTAMVQKGQKKRDRKGSNEMKKNKKRNKNEKWNKIVRKKNERKAKKQTN